MAKQRQIATDPKHAVWKNAKNTTKVLLLLRDDFRPYLKPAQRELLLGEVGKAYARAKKIAELKSKPRISITQATTDHLEGRLSLAELTKGIKDGWIVV